MNFTILTTKCVLMTVSVFVYGCLGKAPESAIGLVSGGTPGSWSATKQAKAGVDSDWVKRFGDRRLTAIVNEALSSNQDMRIAAERVKRAGEAARVAGALSKPQVGITGSGEKRKSNFIGFPFGGSIVAQNYGLGLDVEWEPDIWGTARAARSASLAEWQAGGEDYRAARASLAAQVCKAWFALAETNEQVELAKKAVAIRVKTESAIRDRFERDLRAEGGSASQLRLAKTDVASAKADLSGKRGDLESARRQLELLAGRYPSASVVGRANLPRTPSSPPSGLPSELLLRRPDIIAAERRYSSTVKRIKEAQLTLFPSFKITSSSGTTSGALGQVLNSNFGVWSIGANVFSPILTGGRVRGEIRVRKSNQREALATLHKTVLNAFGEVEQGLASERWLKRREGEIREARNLSRDASKSAEDDYRDGNGDVLTLFVAQTRHIQLESQYASLRRLRLTNQVNLHLALGGGFTIAP